METAGNRRPLGARDWNSIKALARWMSRQNITPNQISIASVGFSALAGLCLLPLPVASVPVTWILCLLAPLFILGRAMCNIIDGMVAVEGGKGTKSGELFNDIPDRVSDTLIIVAMGYATTISCGVEAAWCAALLAVMTAYVRTLGRSLGAPTDFQGPMAKTHRMAVISVACLLTPIELMLTGSMGYMIMIALLIIIIGCAVTCMRRAHAAFIALEERTDV